MTAQGTYTNNQTASSTEANGAAESISQFEALAAKLPLHPRIPAATYRLQFSAAFGFHAAADLVPYLSDLGITDCYTSPLLKAHPGSTHGYDVCDHNALNPAFGSERDYERFVDALLKRGMGQIMDFVPNHMGIAGDTNEAWMDVLENGQGSRFARFFDIDWHPLMAGEWLENKVLLPILGEPYGKVLESQQLLLGYEEGHFYISYFDRRLPIDPSTQVELLSFRLAQLEEDFGPESESLQELQSIITALRHLPVRTETAPQKVAERQREKEVIRRRLGALYKASGPIARTIDETVQHYNGRAGDSRSFDDLDHLLNNQAYRLAYWRVAADEINYRRFFDINDLAAIRVETPEVFAKTHQLVLRLLAEGKVTGIRIDHPDGLWDPTAYLVDLQRSYLLHFTENLACGVEDARGGVGVLPATNDGTLPPLYVVVEKILSKNERLRQDWPVLGTTGYEFASSVNSIFVARANRRAFDNIYATFIGGRIDYSGLVNTSKKMIMLISLASEINMLGYQLKRISAKNRWYRDFTLNSLTFALREVIACLPVYRTYVSPRQTCVDRQDRAYVEAAIAEAKKRNLRTPGSIFDFIGDMMLGRHNGDVDQADLDERQRFVMKFQQTTGPVMAKGVEDTAYYIYNRLCSLNEVGGNPQQFGNTVQAFHQQNEERHARWPHSLSSTSTHDTKRSEDVRARINVLSEFPRVWRLGLARWTTMNHNKKTVVDGKDVPDANEEYLLYQTLLGAWPTSMSTPEEREDFTARIQAYITKAAKEAKVNTSWINPNTAYDNALRTFVRRILDQHESESFLADFAALQQKVAYYGYYNSLAQTLLKIASPGVPDIYQGNEIWDFSLVDPDNRRPVDFALRARMLKNLRQRLSRAGVDLAPLARELLDNIPDGRIKLYVTYSTLTFRRANHALFADGAYVPLQPAGSKHTFVCAFARRLGKQEAIIVVPRLVAGLTGDELVPPIGDAIWGDTALAVPRGSQRYRNAFTGEIVKVTKREGRFALPLSAVFANFPVALLVPTGSDSL